MEQVARDIKRYMTTSIATVFVVTVLGIVDSLIAGRMIGEEALAVTGLAMPLFLISNMTVAVFANGGGVAAAQALGAGDKERASALVCVTLLASCCVAAAAALPLFFFAERVSALLGASDAILQMTSGYVKGSAFMLVVMTPVQCLAAFARADGRPWLSLSMLLLATVFNAFLDVLFIKAGAGMFGVAFATGLSYALAALVLVRYYLSGGCSYRFVDPLRHLALTKVTVATGLPNSLSFLWMTINSLAVNRILAALGGLHLLTASSVMNSTDQLMSFILMGPGYSLLTLMGIYYGKRDGAAIRFIAKRVLSIGLALTAMLALAVFSAPEAIASFFGVKNADAVADCSAALRWLAPAMLARQLSNFLLYYYQSTRHLTLAQAVAFARSLGVFAVVVAPLVKFFGADGIWCIFFVDHGAAVLLACVYALRKSRAARWRSGLLESVLLLPEDFR